MSEDIKEELQTRIKCSPKFAFQVDNSTDVAGLAVLLLFVRHCFEEIAQEQFMFYPLLSETCTTSDIFKAVNDCFKMEDVSRRNCIGICTDTAAALTRHKKCSSMAN
jgi:hypothetical protein